MKYNRLLLFVACCISFVTKSEAQNYRINNGFGLTGGITQFNILTDNFEVEEGNGFLGGFLATVDLPLKWYNVGFGMQFSENPVKISGRETLAITTDETFIEYKLFTVQLAMLLNIKVIPKYFTIDVGPIVQYNSKFEFKDKDQESFYVNNYDNLQASDITDISQFNLNGAIGASLGIKHFKLRAQYMYGFTNMLNKLQKKNLDTSGGEANFKGNQSLLMLGAIVEF
ncbi:hypothetical protein PK35_04925 [Tamlana nanhaiensis]|uniref:Outer membrane protein beta-barrel domain-containing protein n=1 Tax=Neotamlana nanhaiensis TaxID=1382798 RepID=A0A0D7W4M7_9FLAO|nr:outer membrane beta-barrel protein [Tamlana nanhaiensis]KJD34076.1 hypothetical protein PK35_04925 [Tamlana nanhaiensis]